MLDEMLDAFDYQCWMKFDRDKKNFCFQMLVGMLDAFDRLIQHFVQHFICGHAHYALKVDILLLEHHFQFFFIIVHHSKHVAAQANYDDGLC